MSRLRWALVTVSLLFVLSLVSAAQVNGPVQYVYDELGRLIAAIDANGNAAVYNYDAVGNILFINRLASTQVSIISFTPDQGPQASSVTIYGTGFSTTASQNTVQFNGTSAAVVSATANQIVANVPTGATTGLISVTSPAGSASSAANFQVLTGGPPTITGFSPPIAVAGTAVTINGTNFDPTPVNDRLLFNVARTLPTSATATAISTTLPATATSGHITVSTPLGAATSSQDLFVPFLTHTVADVAYTGRTTVGGSSANIALSTAGKIGLLLFDGTPEQRVRIQWTSTISSCTLYLFTPNGTQVVVSTANGGLSSSRDCGSNAATGAIDNVLLPSAGTYTIGVEAPGATGNVVVTISDVSDAAGTITIDGPPVTVTTTKAGQDARLSFSSPGEEKVFLQITNVTNPGATVYLLNVNGETFLNDSTLIAPTTSGQVEYLDTQLLPAVGNYTLWVQHNGTGVGSETLQLNSANDFTAAITIDGSAVRVPATGNTAPGQDGRLTFSATPGQRIAVFVTNVTNPAASVNLVKPDGTIQTYFNIANSPAGYTWFLDTQTLATSGTYQLWVKHNGLGVGNESLRIASVPADFTATLTVPAAGQTGPALQVPTTGNLAAGQNALLTFSGTAGQQLSFNVANSTIGTTSFSCSVTVYDPNNNSVASGYCGTGASNFINTVTLASTGNYTFKIDPVGAAAGSVAISINNDSDVTGTIAIDGAAVTTGTTVAGQDARLSFTATAGQRIVVYATNVTNPGAYVYLVKPDGTNQTYFYINNSPAGQTFFLDTQTLATSGTYQLWVQHSGTNVGNETLRIASVPADFTTTLTIPAAGQTGPAVQVPTTGNLAAGQNALLTFSGTTGQKLSFNVLNPTIGAAYYNCTATLYDPNNNAVGPSAYCGTGAGNYINTVTLASTGTYTFKIDPSGAATGSVAISINNAADVAGTIAIDGAAVTTGTTVAGQDVRLSFTATAGQRIVVYASNVTNPTAYVYLVKPDGTTQTWFSISNSPAGQTFFLDTQTLATSGTYQLWVQHSGANLGNETLQISSVPADITGTLTISGSAVQVPSTGSTSPGQNATLTFSATSGQSLKINVSNSTFTPSTACQLTLKNPSGGTVTSGYCGNGAATPISATASTAGTYTILIDPQGANTGSVSISVTSP